MSWLNYLIYEPQQLQTQTHLWQPEEQPKSRTKSWGQINFHFANQIYCTLCRGLFNYLAGARERARCEQQRWGERFSAIILPAERRPPIGCAPASWLSLALASKGAELTSAHLPPQPATPATIDRHAPIASLPLALAVTLLSPTPAETS